MTKEPRFMDEVTEEAVTELLGFRADEEKIWSLDYDDVKYIMLEIQKSHQVKHNAWILENIKEARQQEHRKYAENKDKPSKVVTGFILGITVMEKRVKKLLGGER